MSDENRVAAVVNAVQQPAQEVPKTEQTPTAEDAFAKKEKQLRRMQQQFEAEKRQLMAKNQEYETNYVPKERLKQEGVRALMDAGWTHEQIMEQMLNATPNNDPTIKAMEAKIRALEERLSGSAKQAEEATSQQYEQAVKQIDREVKLMTDSDPEFESIKSANMHSAVTELIKATFDNEGYLMDVKEAAREVENYLVEQGLQMANLSKVKAKLQPPAADTPETKAPQQNQPGVKTLTNTMTNGSSRLSDKEKRARAIAAFHGQNKG